MPLDTYSRDEMAVVNGGTGTCISSFAPSPRVQPSGVVTVDGRIRGHRCPGRRRRGGRGGADVWIGTRRRRREH